MQVPFDLQIVCPVVIGRSAELAALHRLLDRAKGGTGQLALLSGEAGIGKSRLVAEAKTYATAQDFRLFQGQCFPTDRSCPYAPLLDVLRSHLTSSSPEHVVTDMGSLAPALSSLLPDLPTLSSDLPALPALSPEHEKRRLFAALAQLFLRPIPTRPVLLVVEDLHWSDQTSLDFLHYLARRCAAAPLLVLLTYRSDEVHPGLGQFLAQLDRERLAQEMVLAPLTHSDVGGMVQTIFALPRSMFAAPPLGQGELLDALYALTEGNPFFIEELLKSLIAARDVFYAHGRWQHKELHELHLPRSIQDAVELRTAQLSEAARQVLQLAAVAGRHFDFALLQAFTHHDEAQLVLLLKELIAAHLVVEVSAEQFAFGHALTRQAVSAHLLVRERKALHRAIAETYERLYASHLEAHLADLASHYFLAEAWEQALTYGQRAGEHAQAVYAPQAAIEHFTRALVAAGQLSRTPAAGLYRARGLAYEALGDFERARADHETARGLAHDAADRHAAWQALLDLGMLWAGRDYAKAADYFQRALTTARSLDDSAALAHSLNHLGNWHLNAEQPLDALRCHQEALAIFQARSDQHGTAATLDLLGMASFLSGDLIQGTSYCQQAVVLVRELGDRQRMISSLVTLMMCGGVYETETLAPATVGVADSLQAGEQALTIAVEIGQRSDEAHTLIQMAMCLGPQGEYARALEVAQRGLAVAEAIEHRQWMAAGHRALGALYLDLFALSQAQQHLEHALALAQEVGSLNWIRIISGFLAPVYLLHNDAAAANSILTAALEPDAAMHTLGQRLVWAARAEVALARDDPQRALQILDQLLASTTGLARGASIPRLANMRGQALIKLKRAAEAETILQAARATAREHGLRPWLWRIRLTQGKLARTQRRYDEAERSFAEALHILDDLVRTIPDQNLQRHILQHTRALFPHTRPPSPQRLTKRRFAGLTHRERAVAALIATGKSNREIAEQLVVAPRTIETHVSSILSKLGFSSRTQIAIWAAEKGLLDDAL